MADPNPRETPTSPQRPCCACEVPAVASVELGCFPNVACSGHARIYREQGHQVTFFAGMEPLVAGCACGRDHASMVYEVDEDGTPYPLLCVDHKRHLPCRACTPSDRALGANRR